MLDTAASSRRIAARAHLGSKRWGLARNLGWRWNPAEAAELGWFKLTLSLGTEGSSLIRFLRCSWRTKRSINIFSIIRRVCLFSLSGPPRCCCSSPRRRRRSRDVWCWCRRARWPPDCGPATRTRVQTELTIRTWAGLSRYHLVGDGQPLPQQGGHHLNDGLVQLREPLQLLQEENKPKDFTRTDQLAKQYLKAKTDKQ